MTGSQIWRLFFSIAYFISSSVGASAQMFSSKKVGDKLVQCIQSGVVTELLDCGIHPFPYQLVFVGSITAIKPIEHDEFELRVVPEEVFSGTPDAAMTVLTSQGLCFPKLVVGDRWLFYLRKQDGKPVVLDFYQNRSVPFSDAQMQIEHLRRLQKMGNFAVVKGTVLKGEHFRGKAVRKLPVFAVRKGDDTRVRAVTDRNGHYEFPLLPPGEYVIQIRADYPHRPGDWIIDLTPEACWDSNPDRLPGEPTTE